MSNFTKGRWEADTLYGDHYVVFANDHVVADCFKNADNAQLIAEAPVMYELLNKAFHMLGKNTANDAICREIDECLSRVDGAPVQSEEGKQQ